MGTRLRAASARTLLFRQVGLAALSARRAHVAVNQCGSWISPARPVGFAVGSQPRPKLGTYSLLSRVASRSAIVSRRLVPHLTL